MSGHVLSITSAVVPPTSETALVEAYREAVATLPHSVLHTFLAKGESHEWRIVTLWRSREQLEEYRREAGTPAAIRMFREAGADPSVEVVEVIREAHTE